MTDTHLNECFEKLNISVGQSASNRLAGELTGEHLEGLKRTQVNAPCGPAQKVLNVDLALTACRRGDNLEAAYYLAMCHSEVLRQSMIVKSASLLNEHSLKKGEVIVEWPDDSTEQLLATRQWLLTDWCSARGVEQLRELIELVPSDWTVVQLTERPRLRTRRNRNTTPDLIVTRFRGGAASSLLIAELPAPSSTGCVSFNTEFESILADRLSAIRRISASNGSSNSYRQEQASLDARMRRLLASMQIAWLGWRSFLLAGKSFNSDDAAGLIDGIVAACELRLSADQISRLILVCHHVPSENGILRVAVANILGVSVRDQSCRTLAGRISAWRDSHALEESGRHHVILVLDSNVQKYPWEMLQPLCQGPVSRVPSLSVLHLLLKVPRPCQIKTGNSAYILNPGGDLDETEKRLRQFMNQYGWQGIVGRAPTVSELVETLTKGEVMAYMGHGSGSKYLPSDMLRSLRCSAMALLFGCASGRLEQSAPSGEPYGTPHNYFTASCTTLLGLLWSVTDLHLDAYTKSVLTSWERQGCLSTAVREARDQASLTMMAAAGVVYGLPRGPIAPGKLKTDDKR